MKQRYAVGVDIGGSHVSCSVVDLHKIVIVKESLVHREVNNKANANTMLSAWCEAIDESIAKSGVEPTAAGFAFPGPFDYNNGISKIAGVNKFEGIFGLDVSQALLDRLHPRGITSLKFVNDASAFALGECMGGAARGIDNVMVLTLGTGVGSGFICSGKLTTTSKSVPPNGWVYCLPFENGIADDAFSTRWFCKRYKELTGKDIAGAKEIAEQVKSNTAAAQIFEEYGKRLAQFAAPVCQPFGAGAIVLGGNISRAFAIFEPTLTATLHSLGCNAVVKAATLRDEAPVIGAASLFI